MSNDLEDEEEDEEDSEEEGSESGGRFESLKKPLLFVALPIVLLIGIGAGVYFSGLLDPLLGHDEETVAKAKAEDEVAYVAPGLFIDLDEMLVNLSSGGRKASFVKMRVSLELANTEDEPRVRALVPRIVDSLQVYMREIRVEELQGSHGLYRIREELLMRVNAAAKPAKVRDVLFREMLVQ